MKRIIPEHAMKRPGNRVIPLMKAMLPVVFTAQASESPGGCRGSSAPVPMSPFGFDQVHAQKHLT